MRKGWCPSLLTPMASGDGFLARVKPTAATVSAEAARALAEAAQRYGNGLVDVTNRSNLQFRGFSPDGIAPFADVVFRHGLAHDSAPVEQVRNVAASPLGADDPTATFGAHRAARAIEAMLAMSPELFALPGKFGFSVDGGGALPLGDVGADVLFVPGSSGVAVRVAGAPLMADCAEEDVPAVARALALAFLDLAKARSDPPRRMRHLVDAVGAEAVFRHAGLAPVGKGTPVGRPAPRIGYGDLAGGSGFFLAGVAFGALEAGALSRLADLAEDFEDGTIRLTPWRSLVLVGIAAEAADAVAEGVAAAGLITDPADPRLAMVACSGTPACESATAATRVDAARIAASGVLDGLSGTTLHVSGCAKGCAHPRPAAVTLAGRNGAYDVILNGRADAAPHFTGLDVEGVIAVLATAPWSKPR
ncbi:precorrin-3B synthase [Rhodobium gokarnense]|uniref:Precorrin-3B synthase n=1 Tax=Rhodobium gokarnense TaxID=364296 RepID=A0ABT3H6L9_9HYPH|nr:precorrin-3B synthase [Rhodobium gokarnense]MCW2306030.1 precorrin-3B synthase [Rhodobium gokarnense]